MKQLKDKSSDFGGAIKQIGLQVNHFLDLYLLILLKCYLFIKVLFMQLLEVSHKSPCALFEPKYISLGDAIFLFYRLAPISLEPLKSLLINQKYVYLMKIKINPFFFFKKNPPSSAVYTYNRIHFYAYLFNERHFIHSICMSFTAALYHKPIIVPEQYCISERNGLDDPTSSF
jgi:hypothetical protein